VEQGTTYLDHDWVDSGLHAGEQGRGSNESAHDAKDATRVWNMLGSEEVGTSGQMRGGRCKEFVGVVKEGEAAARRCWRPEGQG